MSICITGVLLNICIGNIENFENAAADDDNKKKEKEKKKRDCSLPTL